MRWVENKVFPHPVLSFESAPPDRDYVNRQFQVTPILEMEAGKGSRLKVTCTLSEQSLTRLIQEGRAKYAMEVHCPKTFLRRLLESNTPTLDAEFKKGELHERVELSPYVVCTADVNGHRSENFHHEFGENAAFDFCPGDVLAAGRPCVYWVVPELAQSIGSIFRLRISDAVPSHSFSLEWDESDIEILMPREDGGKFRALQDNRQMWPSLLASVYLSALTETLRLMADSESRESYGEKKWFRVVSQKLEENEIRLKENTDFLLEAQRLFEWPLGNLLGGEEESS